jgi:hypothetical protein
VSRAAPAACLLAVLALAGPLAAGEPTWLHDAEIERRTAADPAPEIGAIRGTRWIGWSVPGVPGAAEVCCWDRGWKTRGCTLAGRDSGWGTQREGAAPTAPSELRLLLEIDRGAPRSLKLVGESCRVDGAGRAVTWLEGVDPERSLALFDRLARESSNGEFPDRAVAALAHHAGAGADRRLGALAEDRALPRDLREQALFWAGQARGRAGFELLERTLATESDSDLREKAIFALSQSDVTEAPGRIRRAAVDDRDPEIRAQALFWLAQSDAPEREVAAFVLERIAADPDAEVREQGVFALSQLDDGVPHLVRLLESTRDREVRRQALFWLGQSDDPRAVAELERVLLGD